MQSLVERLLDRFVDPVIGLGTRLRTLTADAATLTLDGTLDRYLLDTYERHVYMTSVALLHQRCRLTDIYQPLTLQTRAGDVVVDSYPTAFLADSPRLLVVDGAGMGKSTLLKYLYLRAVENGTTLPVFVELRRLAADVRLTDFLGSLLSSRPKTNRSTLAAQLLDTGNITFFLDGFDEVAEAQGAAILERLEDAAFAYPNNRYVVTSRPQPIPLPSFERCSIKPLDLEQAKGLIRKYDQTGTVAARLCTDLDGAALETVKPLLGNPLLVGLLFAAYNHKGDIPVKEDTFYRQVFEALYNTHDLSKHPPLKREKASRLSMDDFHKIMRAVGFECMRRDCTSFSTDGWLSVIDRAKRSCPSLDFEPARLFTDLQSNVPLLVREGLEWRFVHRTFAEYFAARFICSDASDGRRDILTTIATETEPWKCDKLLWFVADGERDLFDEVIVQLLIDRFKKHEANLRKAVDSWTASWDENGDLDVEDRVVLSFGLVDSAIVASRSAKLRHDRDPTPTQESSGRDTEVALAVTFTNDIWLMDLLSRLGYALVPFDDSRTRIATVPALTDVLHHFRHSDSIPLERWNEVVPERRWFIAVNRLMANAIARRAVVTPEVADDIGQVLRAKARSRAAFGSGRWRDLVYVRCVARDEWIVEQGNVTLSRHESVGRAEAAAVEKARAIGADVVLHREDGSTQHIKVGHH